MPSGCPSCFVLGSLMETESRDYTTGQKVGIGVFCFAIVATSAMITMGVLGVPWPRWLLVLATVL